MGRPSDEAIVLALGAFRDDWICAEDICTVLRNFGAEISVRQVAPALRRMEREPRPRIEGMVVAYGHWKEYRLTDAGRADVSRRFPGLVVRERR